MNTCRASDGAGDDQITRGQTAYRRGHYNGGLTWTGGAKMSRDPASGAPDGTRVLTFSIDFCTEH